MPQGLPDERGTESAVCYAREPHGMYHLPEVCGKLSERRAGANDETTVFVIMEDHRYYTGGDFIAVEQRLYQISRRLI